MSKQGGFKFINLIRPFVGIIPEVAPPTGGKKVKI